MRTNKPYQRLGNLTKDDINFPKQLTPEVVHTALYVHNAPNKLEMERRVEYCAKQIGNEAMAYAMALLVLPWLMDQTKDTQEYKDYKHWRQSRTKTLN